MYRTLFTNARASALFAGAIVLMAGAFLADKDADTLLVDAPRQRETANHSPSSPAADNPAAAAKLSDVGFLEDEELLQPADGEEANPNGMGSPDNEAMPQDTAAPDAMEPAEPASIEPEPDIDPTVSEDDL